jgi:hypothetical protein
MVNPTKAIEIFQNTRKRNPKSEHFWSQAFQKKDTQPVFAINLALLVWDVF